MIFQMDPSDNTEKANIGHVSSMNSYDDSMNPIDTLLIQQSTLWTSKILYISYDPSLYSFYIFDILLY